jgi:hypothetical protein
MISANQSQKRIALIAINFWNAQFQVGMALVMPNEVGYGGSGVAERLEGEV